MDRAKQSSVRQKDVLAKSFTQVPGSVEPCRVRIEIYARPEACCEGCCSEIPGRQLKEDFGVRTCGLSGSFGAFASSRWQLSVITMGGSLHSCIE